MDITIHYNQEKNTTHYCLEAILRSGNNFPKSKNGESIMNIGLNNDFKYISTKEEIKKLNKLYELRSPETIEKFIEENKITCELLKLIESPLTKHFPTSKISLEVCDKLEWSDDTKLLVNISVSEDMFFNGILDNLNAIYKETQPILDEYVSTILLFPEIETKNLESVKMNSNSTINVIARTAYFNTYNDYEIEREITLRDIPKNQRKKEIMEYAKTHDVLDSWDIAEELRLETEEVEEILEELMTEEIIREWK